MSLFSTAAFQSPPPPPEMSLLHTQTCTDVYTLPSTRAPR